MVEIAKYDFFEVSSKFYFYIYRRNVTFEQSLHQKKIHRHKNKIHHFVINKFKNDLPVI